MIYSGACHCGAVEVALHSNKDVGRLPARACACSFCRKHGARTWTDPDGSLKIVCDDTDIQTYRFALKTADYLICKTCGLYVAAVVKTEHGVKSTLNINLLDNVAVFDQPSIAANYDGETATERLERRAQNWTPTEISRRR